MLYKFIILLSILLFVKNNDICVNKKCFECIYSNCIFTESECKQPPEQTTRFLSSLINIDKCLTIIDTCTDTESMKLINTYCQLNKNETQNSNANVYSFSIKENHKGTYGDTNLFCKVDLPQLKNQSKLTFYLENNNIENQEIQPIFLEILKNSSEIERYTLSQKDNYKLLDDIKKISLYYYQKSILFSSPFELVIVSNNTIIKTPKKEGMSIGIYIGIGCVVLACIGFSIFIYFCSKKLYNKKVNASIEQISRNATLNRANRRNSTRKKSRKSTMMTQINKLFATELKPIGYSEYMKEQETSCTVCLELFKKNIKICVTPCGHIFHYKCLHDWLYGNAMNPKCPNCNNNLLAKIQGEDTTNAITITRTRRTTRQHDRQILQDEITNRMQTTEVVINDNHGRTNNNHNTNHHRIGHNICEENLNDSNNKESEEVEIDSVE